MIDFNAETLLSLNDARELMPRRRVGVKPTLSTMYRWCRRGFRGVVLETIQIGATRCTSREALARFFDALGTGVSGGEQRAVRPTAKSAASDLQELAAAGYT